MTYFFNLLLALILKRKYILNDTDRSLIKKKLFNLLGLIKYLKLDNVVYKRAGTSKTYKKLKKSHLNILTTT